MNTDRLSYFQEWRSGFKVFYRFFSSVFDVIMADKIIRDFYLWLNHFQRLMMLLQPSKMVSDKRVSDRCFASLELCNWCTCHKSTLHFIASGGSKSWTMDGRRWELEDWWIHWCREAECAHLWGRDEREREKRGRNEIESTLVESDKDRNNDLSRSISLAFSPGLKILKSLKSSEKLYKSALYYFRVDHYRLSFALVSH